MKRPRACLRTCLQARSTFDLARGGGRRGLAAYGGPGLIAEQFDFAGYEGVSRLGVEDAYGGAWLERLSGHAVAVLIRGLPAFMLSQQVRLL